MNTESTEQKVGIIELRRRWVFSSSSRTAIAKFGPSGIRVASHALFSLVFPDNCRVCGRSLETFSRIPVCAGCLSRPEPISAEFFCVSCRTPFLNQFPLDEEGRCALCRAGLRGFDAAYCYGSYEGVLRQLIHLYKYACIRTLSQPLSNLLARALPRDEAFDAVVPVPLHWRKRWARGFNQSALLARSVASRSGIPYLQVLRRARFTSVQAGLSNTARRKNVAAAFQVKRGTGSAEKISGRRILLIDDVMTTGATAAACASVLKRAGAARVALLTIARVDRRMSGVQDWNPDSTLGGRS
jgi:competence protein ComFC